MIDINKKYKTKDGKEVRIYATDGGKPYTVHGAIKVSESWGAFYWTSAGFYQILDTSLNDLVEVKPKVKYLLSIKEILEKFPDTYFNTNGSLCNTGETHAILPKMLQYFGKPLSQADEEFVYLPQWIVEKEEEGNE